MIKQSMATQALDKRDVEAKHGNADACKQRGRSKATTNQRGSEGRKRSTLIEKESLGGDRRPLLVAFITLDH